jgi:hypothetical protein
MASLRWKSGDVLRIESVFYAYLHFKETPLWAQYDVAGLNELMGHKHQGSGSRNRD